MSDLHILTAIASATAAAFFAMRANMLKRESSCWVTAPFRVRVSVFGMGAAFALHSQLVLFAKQTSWTELMVAGAAAVYGFSLWLNLWRQRHPPTSLGGLPAPS